MTPEAPYTLIAELTYRCPLRCGYCSNPLDWASRKPLVDEGTWLRVISEAADLGVLGVHLTGGEPLLNAHLESLVAGAHARELYSTLVTSGVPLSHERLVRLRDAGLDAVQLSLQDAEPASADRIAGRPSHAQKLKVARWVRELGLPLTLNVVLHRNNVERVQDVIELAADLGAQRLELANVQVLSWALAHRDALLPTAAQITSARSAAAQARSRLAGRMEIVFVLPDYFTGRPRACMDGWGRRYVVVTPEGLALPCHGAHAFPGLDPPSVMESSLAAIWYRAELFRAFRGEDWMREPCRSCELRGVDFGGCRCQALALTGDPAATDPSCSWSPHHDLVLQARRAARTSSVVPLRLRKGGEL